MRYLLRGKNYSQIFARRDYLSKTFNLWFTVKGVIGSFVVLESFPHTIEDDICIIYGHNNEVADLLRKYEGFIPEKNIFIIACYTKNPKDFIVLGKNIFVAPQKKDEGVKLRKGSEFNFEFDISDVELNLFNSRIDNIYDKLKCAFKEK